MVRIIGYSPKGSREYSGLSYDQIKRLKEAVVWFDLEKPTKEEIAEVGSAFGIHPLAVEDCQAPHQRTKVDLYGDSLFITLRTIDASKEAATYQISVFVNKTIVITFRDRPSDELERVRAQIAGNGQILRSGPDFLLYSIIDQVVDGYLRKVDALEDKIEGVEQAVLSKPTKKTLNNIFRHKHVVLSLKKDMWPMRQVVDSIMKANFPQISEEVRVYMRDVYDHIFRVLDMLETSRELLSGCLDIYLSSISNSMNQVMKTLTVLMAALLIPNLIAAIGGMNFRGIPSVSFMSVVGAMVLILLTTLVIFKKKQWF